MRPYIRIGLIAGGIGLVLNSCLAAAMGLCGPFLALAAGAIAGFLASRAENPTARAEGARLGAISGGITGALVFIGQIIGAVGILLILQLTGMQMPFGTVPPTGSDPASQAAYYVSGLGVGVCFGVVGILTAALGGAGAGYPAPPQHTA